MKRIAELSDEEKRVLVAEACGVPKGWHLIKRSLYWRPDGAGYTSSLAEAGLYSDDDCRAVRARDQGSVSDNLSDPLVFRVRPKLPDYLASLDACAAMEDTLTDAERALYAFILSWESVEEIYEWLDGGEFNGTRFGNGGLPPEASWIELPSLEAFKNLVHRSPTQRVDSYLLAKKLALP